MLNGGYIVSLENSAGVRFSYVQVSPGPSFCTDSGRRDVVYQSLCGILEDKDTPLETARVVGNLLGVKTRVPPICGFPDGVSIQSKFIPVSDLRDFVKA